ncbi:Carboxypeptidase A4, partial [Quaeritorhiza haematococci]
MILSKTLLLSLLAAAGCLNTLTTLTTALPTTGTTYPFANHAVYQFRVSNDDDLELLKKYLDDPTLELDVWSETLIGKVDIRIPPKTASLLQDTLLKQLPNSILIPDVQALVDRERSHSLETASRLASSRLSSALSPDVIFSDYQDTDTYVEFLSKTIPASTKVEIGKSYLNETIYGIKFGSGKQNIVFHGGIHAREWIAPAVATYIGWSLGTEEREDIKKLRERFTFVVVPVVNVDGYKYTRTEPRGRMWRKNRQPNPGSNCIGTDPNRNWGYEWGKAGSSTNPCADSYQGPAPFSAPESKAMADYLKKLGNVVSYIDFHAFSQLWMYPFGYTCRQSPPTASLLKQGGALATAALKSINGVSYTNGMICPTIYAASGGSVDWTYAEA